MRYGSQIQQVDASGIAANAENLNYPHAIGKFEFVTSTQARLIKLSHNKLLVNGELVDISSGIVVNNTDNLINADGSDSGANLVAAVTINCHAYVSNSLASHAPSSVRISATSPTNGYLATDGNGANWRHVGWLRSSAGVFVSKSLVGYGLNRFSKRLTADVQKTSGSAGFNNLLAIDGGVVMKGGWISAHAAINTKYDSDAVRAIRFAIVTSYSPVTWLYPGGNNAYVPANQDHTLNMSWKSEELTDYSVRGIVAQYYYPGSGTIDLLHDNTYHADERGCILEVQTYNHWC